MYTYKWMIKAMFKYWLRNRANPPTIQAECKLSTAIANTNWVDSPVIEKKNHAPEIETNKKKWAKSTQDKSTENRRKESVQPWREELG